MNAELAEGEALAEIYVGIEAMVTARVAESDIRIWVIRGIFSDAAEAGLEILRGPEITEYHLPTFPGDAAYIRATAVIRSPE